MAPINQRKKGLLDAAVYFLYSYHFQLIYITVDTVIVTITGFS